MTDQTPIACDITAIDDSERENHRQAAEDVFAAVSDLRELPDGYGFRLPTETKLIQQAGAFISRERRCCPFFNFALEVKPDRGPVWLKMTGRRGVKQYIEETVLPCWNVSKDAS